MLWVQLYARTSGRRTPGSVRWCLPCTSSGVRVVVLVPMPVGVCVILACDQAHLKDLAAERTALAHALPQRPVRHLRAPPVHDDHVQRDCIGPAPDQAWGTDITEHPTTPGKL